MQYIRNLDGVRALAIILVMLFHYDFILQFGWVGVQLFFVLSGYLITTILLEDKKQPLPLYLKGFYWRRSLRIFPVYYFYIFVIGIGYLLFQLPHNYASIFPFLVTYTYNLFPLFSGLEFDFFFTHFWSLSIEEQFYLLWPLLIYWCNERQTKFLIIGIICLSPVCRYFFAEYLLENSTEAQEFIGEVVYRFTFNQLDSFAFGAAIPVFSLTKLINRPKILFIAVLAFMILVGQLNLISLGNSYSFVNGSSLGFHIGLLANYQHIWSYSLLAFVFMALILWCLKDQKNILLKILFENRFMVFIGKISYGIYIYHWIVRMAFGKFLDPYVGSNQIIGFLLYFTICTIISYLSYLIIEKPVLSLKGRYFSRKSALLN